MNMAEITWPLRGLYHWCWDGCQGQCLHIITSRRMHGLLTTNVELDSLSTDLHTHLIGFAVYWNMASQWWVLFHDHRHIKEWTLLCLWTGLVWDYCWWNHCPHRSTDTHSPPQHQRSTPFNKLDSQSLRPLLFIFATCDEDFSTTLLLPLYSTPLFLSIMVNW